MSLVAAMGLCNSIIQQSYLPPSDLPIDIWIEQNVRLGTDSDLSGSVSFDLLPMSRFFLRACQNPKVETVIVMCSAQSTKTKNAEFILVWRICNNPGPTGWFTDMQESARELSQTRLEEDLKGCEALRDEWPRDRNRQKWALIQFSAMNLFIRGVEALRMTERTSLEWVLCDERRNYPPGRMAKIKERYKTFRQPKEISFSTAGMEHDEFHQAYLQGSQHLFYFTCLRCGHRQPFRFGRHATTVYPEPRSCGGLIWEDSKATHPSENVWVFDEVRKTVRYQCENSDCKREYRNFEKPSLIATMNESNNWGAVQQNPMASESVVSMHWGELYMPWAKASWETTVEKFLKAMVNLKRTNNREPLKIFITESLGEPDREEVLEVKAEALLARQGLYLLGEQWPEDKDDKSVLILTFDKQQGYVVYVIRQWKMGGASRLIQCGQVPDFEELRKLQQSLYIKDKCVWGDCAYEPDKVFAACHSYGWYPLYGSEHEEFTSKVWDEKTKEKKSVKSYFKSDAFRTRWGLIKRFIWSDSHYLDLLYGYMIPGEMAGEVKHRAPLWEIPSNKPYDYVKEMSSIERVKKVDADGVVKWEFRWTGRHDFPICELEQIVVADQSSLFIAPDVKP